MNKVLRLTSAYEYSKKLIENIDIFLDKDSPDSMSEIHNYLKEVSQQIDALKYVELYQDEFDISVSNYSNDIFRCKGDKLVLREDAKEKIMNLKNSLIKREKALRDLITN